MKRIAWLTDIHMNFLPTPVQVNRLFSQILAQNPDVVLVSGDIGEARSLARYLPMFDSRLQRPVYFVLGNHDFYFGSFAGVHGLVDRLCGESKWLKWLNRAGVVELTPATALVGHDSWADGRCGDYEHSDVILNDFVYINDLAGLSKQALGAKLNALGDEAADTFARLLPEAFRKYQRVILLTHVPPFAEACWYEGQVSGDEFLPHFACKAVGSTLLEIMSGLPDRHLTVLCGHTHNGGTLRLRDNLIVRVGQAEYGVSQVQDVLDIE
jgi:3',5'-cyclic AMP phosphodiesterase CpdA